MDRKSGIIKMYNNFNVKKEENMSENREDLSAEVLESVKRGLEQSKNGDTVDLGSFAQYR